MLHMRISKTTGRNFTKFGMHALGASIDFLSAMSIGESGHGIFIINHHCILLIYSKLEGPRDMKLGTLYINDVQMLLQILDLNPSDGGAIT